MTKTFFHPRPSCHAGQNGVLTAGAKQQPIGQNLRSSSRSSKSSSNSSRSSRSNSIRLASTQKAFEALACQSTHCYNALTLLGKQTENNCFQIGCLHHEPHNCYMPPLVLLIFFSTWIQIVPGSCIQKAAHLEVHQCASISKGDAHIDDKAVFPSGHRSVCIFWESLGLRGMGVCDNDSGGWE